MATRSEVRKTDNSKLGRGVLTNRAGHPSLAETSNARVVEVKKTPKVVADAAKTPAAKKTKSNSN